MISQVTGCFAGLVRITYDAASSVPRHKRSKLGTRADGGGSSRMLISTVCFEKVRGPPGRDFVYLVIFLARRCQETKKGRPTDEP